MVNDDLSLKDVYLGILEDIRRTDDISFKLLALVPLVSGVGLVSIVFGEKISGFEKDGRFSLLAASILAVLSLFAALITLGLLRWELRNVQTCKWLSQRAQQLEQVTLDEDALGETFFSRPVAPTHIGKEIAEKFIYSATIITWLAFPVATGAIDGLASLFVFVYYGLSTLILVITVLSWFSKTSVTSKETCL